MDVVTALNTHVKQSLADVFGVSMTNMIILECSRKAGVAVMGLNTDGYTKLVNTIASDERVVQMLGQDGARAKRDAWAALVK
ncbi:MAG: hypothetical protein GXP27_09175 [Planctomycetes bacterium]|nr:hypothetical protein [Planctomycetota bacterium]